MKLPFIKAGEIVTTHGVRGEVKVLPWVDSAEVLAEFDRCRIDGKEYAMTCRIQKSCNLVKLEGIDTVEAAQALRGKTMELYREDAPAGVTFAAELIGMTVFTEGKPLGTLTEVLDYPGNQVYVVKGEREYMIPAVREFILHVDMAGNKMEVKLLEGMETDAD